MATIRDLKNRIRAVENIRKITRAMQLVAAAKLNRAQQRAHAVRPFADELDRVLGGLAGGGIEESADVAIEFAYAEGVAPVLSVFGGKITTYRRLAEHALEKLAPYFPAMKPAWTGQAPIPGSDFADR